MVVALVVVPIRIDGALVARISAPWGPAPARPGPPGCPTPRPGNAPRALLALDGEGLHELAEDVLDLGLRL
eukprot:10410220-Alexandrium_andersonii.AAC.1